MAYATPGTRKDIPKWVVQTWAFVRLASVITMIGAFLFMLAYDGGHVSPSGSTRPLMAFYLALLALGLMTKCLLAPFVALGWRVSTALAVPFLFWQVAVVYSELAYLRDGWPWMNVYPDARGAISLGLAGLVWLAVSWVGFVSSRRRGRATSVMANPAPRPSPE